MEEPKDSKTKQLFGQNHKISERVINIDSSKQLQGGHETDTKFVDDLLAIAEHSQTTDKNIFAKRANLTENDYKFIEETGQLHYQANKFNQTSLNPDQIPEQDKCKCGCGRAKGQPLSLCIDEQKNTFFGQGIILFFYYTKKMMLLIFAVILVYGIFSLVTNLVSDDTDQNCEKPGALAFMCDLKIKGEIQNKQDKPRLILIQMWLGFVFCLLWSVAVRLIKRLGRRKSQEIDDLLDSSSDEAIFISKLPIGEYHQRDILIFMKQTWQMIDREQKTPLRIKSVQIIYNMSEVRQKISEIKELASKMLQYIEKTKSKGSINEMKTSHKIIDSKMEKYLALKDQITTKYQQLLEFREKFLAYENFRRQYASECALVHFVSNEDQAIFLQEYGEFKSSIVKMYMQKIKRKLFPEQPTCLFKEKSVKIYKAPEPSDIFWLHCEKKNQLRRTIVVWLLNLVLSLVSFGFLYLFRAIKQANPKIPALSIVSIIAVNLFNRFIWNILLNIVFIEENYSKTINIMSVMNKSYASQLINIILIPLILNTVVTDDINGPSGLAGQAHDFQLTSFIFMTIFNLVNVPHRTIQLIKCFPCLRRAVIRYFCRVTGEFDSYDQMRDALVFLYEPPLVPVAGFYVYITSIVGQAYFFCHLEPILIFYLLGNIILFHLMNRYIVFRMGKITDLLDINIFQTVTGFALNVPLLYGISSIIFLKLNGDAQNFGYYVPSILCFIIWFLSVQSPFNLYSKLITWMIKTFFQKPKPTLSRIDSQKQLKDSSNDKIINPTDADLDLGMPQNLKTAMQVILKNAVSKRKQNYFGAIGTNDMFNFQSKLQEVKGKYHGKAKQFCERFYLDETNYDQMNPEIKASSIREE